MEKKLLNLPKKQKIKTVLYTMIGRIYTRFSKVNKIKAE